MRYSVVKGTFPRVTHPSATDILLCPFDLHVLSLPPAFVLSQDQTLMLRIQSLAKITFEIDENFTPVLQSSSLRTNPTTSVTSLDKRDRQSLFPDQPKPVHDPADHVSLSSIFNCQITDGQHRPSLTRSSKNHPNQIRLNSHQFHQETLERVRRPPEAPPLSFDGRVIGPPLPSRQQPISRKCQKSTSDWYR